MTIVKEYNNYTLSCDCCGLLVMLDFDTFDDAIDYARHEGWKTIRKHGEWLNLCPECAGELEGGL